MKTGTKEFIYKFGSHIKKVSKAFGIKRVWLFGSATDNFEKELCAYRLFITEIPEKKYKNELNLQ